MIDNLVYSRARIQECAELRTFQTEFLSRQWCHTQHSTSCNSYTC